jgi:membrane protein DedA with SNARE-associated domain
LLNDRQDMERTERSVWLRWAAGVALVASLAGTWYFGARAVRSYALLRSATELGLPAVANVRPWMTLGYVATTYDAPYGDLAERLQLPVDTPESTTLNAIAQSRRIPPIVLVEEVQAAVAALAPAHPPGADVPQKESAKHVDDYLSALLAYRYPALALVLLVGAIGLPVPTGFTTLLAGSMVAIGEMSWPVATAIAVGASVGGDVIGYAVGRLADESFLDRAGRWVGYSGHRKTRIQRLFADWGGLTILLTRTLVSHLSSLANLLAGISRYSFTAFLGYATLGRLLWTAAYLGLGYVIGNNIEAAGVFLQQVTGLVLCLGLALIIASYLLAPYFRTKPADA